MCGHTITIVNQQSGVGKTTSAIHIATILSQRIDGRVLMVDTDPLTTLVSRSNISVGHTSLDECMSGQCLAADCVVEVTPHFHLLPCTSNLIGFEIDALNRVDREQVLRQVLQPMRERYQYILVDTPASLGLLTINAMTAADELLVPLRCDYFAMGGVPELMSTVGRVRQVLNPKLEVHKLFVTHVNHYSRTAERNLSEMRKVYGDMLAKTQIDEGDDMQRCYEQLVDELY